MLTSFSALDIKSALLEFHRTPSGSQLELISPLSIRSCRLFHLSTLQYYSRPILNFLQKPSFRLTLLPKSNSWPSFHGKTLRDRLPFLQPELFLNLFPPEDRFVIISDDSATGIFAVLEQNKIQEPGGHYQSYYYPEPGLVYPATGRQCKVFNKSINSPSTDIHALRNAHYVT